MKYAFGRVPAVVVGALLLTGVLAVSSDAGHQTSVASFTGCLKVSGGTLSRFAVGDSPASACPSGHVVVHVSGGDITAVNAGTGLTGTATQGPATLSVDFASFGACPPGSAIRVIGPTATCETDDASTSTLERPGFTRVAIDTGGDVGLGTSATIGVDGLGLISYWDSTNGDLKVAHCQNVACTSATTTTVDSVGMVGLPNSITIGADGLGLISYQDFTSPSDQDLKVAHCENVACTSATTTTVDAVGQAGVWNSITIGADGRGLIAYWANAALKVAHCSNVACTAATTATHDSEGNVGLSTSITIGADGLGLISFRDNFTQELKVAHCENVTCTTVTTSTFDTNPFEANTFITTGEDGLGLIAYGSLHDAGGFLERDLKVARCENAACSTQTTSTVATGLTSDFMSIAIGPDGLGLISYDANGLKAAHCADATCTSATSSTVDPGGRFGEFNAITIGADGLGLISYWDDVGQDLRVAHLSNPFGVPYFRRR